MGLREALYRWDHRSLLNRVDRALAGSDAQLETWAASDDVWGGDGSIADGVGSGMVWRDVEVALVALGEYQIENGVEHERMNCWICSFKDWLRQGT